jgi:ATP-dependent Clp endopeptidase proteolytic subunit ClpP
MAQNWYAFKNAPDKDGEVELSLYDEIGSFGIGAKEFIAELKEHKDQHIHLRINSPGGEIVEGSAIYNALTRHKGGLTVHIDALAASMASVIAMSGDPVYMADNALLMIHNPWTLAAGEAKDLRKQADLLDTMKSNLIRAYQKKSGMEEKAIAKLMDEETWLDAVEAVALGFVDAIEDGIPAAASAREMRARFDNFAKAKMENTVISETAEVSAPAADPVVEETPVAAETVEAVADAPVVEEAEVVAVEEVPVAEEPQAAVTADSLVAKISDMAAKLAEVEARATAAEAELSKVKEAFAALEKGAGVAAATVVPTVASEDKSDPVAQWMDAVERKDYAAAGDLYANHKRAIWAAREKLSKATS